MANYVINAVQDMSEQLKRFILKGPLVHNNINAHTFNITVVNGDDPVPMSGITANFMRSNNTTVPLDSTYCSASGNVATVTLPQTCYAIPGSAMLTVNCTIDGATTCIGWFDCTVLRATTDTIVDPGTVLPSITDLITEIETVAASIPEDYSTLSSQVSTNTGNISTLQTAVAGKQDTLTFDDTPTASSNNPVKSGGVYSALTQQSEDITDLNGAVGMLEAGSLSALNANRGDTPVAVGDGTWSWKSLGYVTPQMFGANGDGVTDDTEAIQNAFSVAQNTDVPLYFPAGTYVLNSPISITKNGVVIKGESPNVTRIECSVSAIKSGLDISAQTIHRAFIENLYFNATSDDISIIDFVGFNYSKIFNCIIAGTGKDNGCVGINCYGTGINGFYNHFSGNDIGSCDVGYKFFPDTISGVVTREPNANLVVGGRIFSCNIGCLDCGYGNKYIGSTLENNVIDIQVGFGANADEIKYGGNPCIIATYHEGASINQYFIKICNNTCRGVIWIPAYATGQNSTTYNEGTSCILFRPSSSALKPLIIDSFISLGETIADKLSVVAKSAYPTIRLKTTNNSSYLLQNVNGNRFRVLDEINGYVLFEAFPTTAKLGILYGDMLMSKSYISSERPTAGVQNGCFIFDSTLGKPIWKVSGGWVDAMGNSV